mmetsp:Transcript_35231/g.85577  ORF Transcript_35231/g.85577 Transcript_35231/m.85577 type:complete len:124 (-) Transcript_35231:335-706(-)
MSLSLEMSLSLHLHRVFIRNCIQVIPVELAQLPGHFIKEYGVSPERAWIANACAQLRGSPFTCQTEPIDDPPALRCSQDHRGHGTDASGEHDSWAKVACDGGTIGPEEAPACEMVLPRLQVYD